MSLPEVEQFVTELLATGEMNEDTSADLGRILAEARTGESHPDDLEYLRALHARILGAGAVTADAAVSPVAGDGAEDLRREIEQLRAELADAHRIIEQLRSQLPPVV